MDNLRVIIGRAHPNLGKRIVENLGIKATDVLVENFADGEIKLQIQENIRGKDVFIVQPTHPPADNLFELLLMIDAAKRSSARRVTAVTPYLGYGRQDRKDRPRVALSSKLVCNLLENTGADRVLTMELHSPQIQGFLDIPSDHLITDNTFQWFLQGEGVRSNNFKKGEKLVIASPDVGGVKRIENFAKDLKAEIAIVYKRRVAPNKAKAIDLIGEVEGATVIIMDDIIDTGGTLTKAAALLKQRGASKVFACCTHGLFSGKALERIKQSPLEAVIVTDTLPMSEKIKSEKIETISVSSLFAAAIKNIHLEHSVSVLFKKQHLLYL